MGQPVTGVLRPFMGGDELVIAGVKPHFLRATADAQGLTHQTEGCRVVGIVKDDVTIPMQFGLLPHRQVIRCLRQRL